MTVPHDLQQLEEQFLEHLDGIGPPPDTSHLSAEDQHEIGRRFGLIRQLRQLPTNSGPAPREPDPVAAFFGFDREGETIAVDGTRIKTLRDQQHFKALTFIAAVNTAGGDLPAKLARDLEQSKSYELAQPTASAIAAVLGTPVAEFESTFVGALDQLQAFLESPELASLIAEFEQAYGCDPETALAHVGKSLVGARFRADGDPTAHYLAAARAVLEEWVS